ncbi:MAG: hypothetical protein ACUVTP_05485 [Candidatus Fervidibacter sp.]|uniref:hypothetical protein n=1 Tax=Candidatus Fervidibacter sp. TaxID=3100871 RepID=UPI00404A9666
MWSGYDSTMTDDEGFYELKAYAGQQTIFVEHRNYQSKEVKVDVPAHGTVNLDIKLECSRQP